LIQSRPNVFQFPFCTCFNVGVGEKLFVDGIVISDKAWHSMDQQVKENFSIFVHVIFIFYLFFFFSRAHKDIQPKYTFVSSYRLYQDHQYVWNGGSSLRISVSNSNSDTYIPLFNANFGLNSSLSSSIIAEIIFRTEISEPNILMLRMKPIKGQTFNLSPKTIVPLHSNWKKASFSFSIDDTIQNLIIETIGLVILKHSNQSNVIHLGQFSLKSEEKTIEKPKILNLKTEFILKLETELCENGIDCLDISFSWDFNPQIRFCDIYEIQRKDQEQKEHAKKFVGRTFTNGFIWQNQKMEIQNSERMILIECFDELYEKGNPSEISIKY